MAAIAAGVDEKTARKAWLRGYGDKAPEGPCRFMKDPLMVVIAREQDEAKAIRQQEKERTSELFVQAEAKRLADVQALAVRDSVSVRAQEGRIVEKWRQANENATGGIHALSFGIRRMCERMGQELERHAAVIDETGKPKEMSPSELRAWGSMLASIDKFLRGVSDSNVKCAEAERITNGEPTKVVEHRVEVGAVTADRLRERAAYAQRVAERMERMKAGSVERILDSATPLLPAPGKAA